MNILKQKKNFITREIKIADNSVYYKVTKYNNCDEIVIQFENISGEKVSHKYSNNAGLIGTLVILISAIIIAISASQNANIDPYAPYYVAAISLFLFLNYWFTKADYWKIKLNDNGFILIHKNIPDRKSSNNFYDSLIQARNEYLNDNYGIIDENIDYQTQLGELKWLKSINAISKNEFEQKLSQLKKIVKPTKNDIGFSK